MKHRYLEVTFRNGKRLAAYLYLDRNPDDLAVRTEKYEEGILIDFAADGRAIGIEMTAPTRISLEALNRALVAVKEDPATADELGPVSVG